MRPVNDIAVMLNWTRLLLLWFFFLSALPAGLLIKVEANANKCMRFTVQLQLNQLYQKPLLIMDKHIHKHIWIWAHGYRGTSMCNLTSGSSPEFLIITSLINHEIMCKRCAPHGLMTRPGYPNMWYMGLGGATSTPYDHHIWCERCYEYLSNNRIAQTSRATQSILKRFSLNLFYIRWWRWLWCGWGEAGLPILCIDFECNIYMLRYDVCTCWCCMTQIPLYVLNTKLKQ